MFFYLNGGWKLRGWAVVMTKPNCEGMAVSNLQRQGFECYFPRFQETKPSKPTTIKPLFPRYLFVFIKEAWYSIRGTRGVSYILAGEDGPAIVPDSIINSIRSKEDKKGFIVLGGTTERFVVGDKIKATDGPLVGINLIYQGMAAHDRVKVLTEMLGRQVSIEINESLLVGA